MASVIYGKCYLWQMYYGKCNYGKSIYGKSIMANETEPIKYVSSKTICFVTTSNTLKYCYNVVFLFHSSLIF